MPEIKTKNEKSLNIYTQMMKNVINIQEKKRKIENDIRQSNQYGSIKNGKDVKKSLTPSLKYSGSNRNKRPPITRKPNSVSNLNPLKTILKNSQSNENLKKVGHEHRKKKIINKEDNFRSRSADFSAFCQYPTQKSIDWNDLKDLIDIHFSDLSSRNKDVQQNELEIKLNEMKKEIDDLKQTIRSQEVEPKKNINAEAVHSDLAHGLNHIISNYSEKLAHINKQIVDMKHKEAPEQIHNNKNNISKDYYLNQIELELKEYKIKCNDLEKDLESKNKKIDEYHALFKEISQNVSGLITEMENKGKETSQSISVNVTESKSINNLLINLAKFEKTMKPEKAQNDVRKKSKDFSTTDTLIDADSSFAEFAESLKRANFNSRDLNKQLNMINNLNDFNQVLKPFTENDLLKKQKKNNYSNTNLKNHYDFYDDEEDEEKIVFSMEDLSITTIQISDNTTESVESLPPLKDQDDEFQKDLHILDEKILKVKKLIDSMKSS